MATTTQVAALLAVLFAPIGAAFADAPQTLLLWPSGAPGAASSAGAETVRLSAQGERIVSNVHAPSIAVFLPPPVQGTGTAMVVLPGGGHTELWIDHEGYAVAAFLAAHGVAAYVLKYRLAHAPGSPYTIEGDALADVQRAIRMVRSRAKEWHLDPERVGVMGFSAGGQLAALAGTRYRGGEPNAADAIERETSRPSFQVLIYPAIPPGMTLSPDTPPAFLLCGADDQAVNSQGLAELYVAMRRAGARAELHIYDGVGHGFGLRASNKGPSAAWPSRLMEWLEQEGFTTRH
jgi:acetyl esterase/lipase